MTLCTERCGCHLALQKVPRGGSRDFLARLLSWCPALLSATPILGFRLQPGESCLRKASRLKAVRDSQADFRTPVVPPVVPMNIFVPAPPPIRKLAAVPVAQQPHLPNKPIATPVSPQAGTTRGIQAQGANAVSRPMANQQIIHAQRLHLAGTQRSAVSHDPPLSSIGNHPAAFHVRSTSCSNSQPAAVCPPVSHNARPDLIAHHTIPQLIYHDPQGTSSLGSQSMAQPTGPHGTGIRLFQQRTPSTPNVLPPNPHSQPVDDAMNLIPMVHQQLAMTQGSVPAVQAVPSDANQLQNQHSTTSIASLPSLLSQQPQTYSCDPAAAAFQATYSTQFPTMHPQSTPMGPAQTHRIARKPTNPSHRSSAQNPAPTPLPMNHAKHLSNSHSPTTSISRASTVSSNHSSSSHSSAPALQLLASPTTSPQSPHANPAPPSAQSQHYPQLQYPFPTQATNVIKRGAAPPPRPPSLRQVKAVHAFAPEQGNELGFKIGDVLDVLDDSSEDGWWEARLQGEVGAIPAISVTDI